MRSHLLPSLLYLTSWTKGMAQKSAIEATLLLTKELEIEKYISRRAILFHLEGTHRAGGGGCKDQSPPVNCTIPTTGKSETGGRPGEWTGVHSLRLLRLVVTPPKRASWRSKTSSSEPV